LNNFIRKLIFTIVFFTTTAISTHALALTKGFQAISLNPATDGGPYIGIWGSENLDQLEWELGTLGVYAYRPLQLTVNGNRTRGILDNTIVQHFYGQLGVVDQWLSIGFDLPMGWWAQFRDPNVAGATNQNKVVVGDATINLKTEFLKTEKFGLALRPFLTIPTGYGGNFFGNGTVTGGGTLIAEINPIERWSISLNAGVQGRQEFNFRDIKKDTQLELGLGTAVQIAKPVSLVAEIATTTRFMDPFAEKVETPTEARGAVKWKIGKTGLLASAGGTAGIIRGSGAPTYSVFAGISFSPRRRERRPKPAAFDFSDYTVHFASGFATIADDANAKKLCDLSDKIRDKKIPIKVTGYTDSTGSETTNQKLSEQRATKAAWWFKLLGIDPIRIMTDGEGEADPIGNNSTREGRALNRRVEFSK